MEDQLDKGREGRMRDGRRVGHEALTQGKEGMMRDG